MNPEELKNKKEELKSENKTRLFIQKHLKNLLGDSNVYNKSREEVEKEIDEKIESEEDRSLAKETYKKGKAAKDAVDQKAPAVIKGLKEKNEEKKKDLEVNKIISNAERCISRATTAIPELRYQLQYGLNFTNDANELFSGFDSLVYYIETLEKLGVTNRYLIDERDNLLGVLRDFKYYKNEELNNDLDESIALCDPKLKKQLEEKRNN